MKANRQRRWKCLLVLAAAILVLASQPLVLAQDPGFRSAAGGMKIRDLAPGTGPAAQTGQVATIHFIGWLDEAGVRGRELYNSRGRGEPVSFVIGTDKVMPAWNEGVIGMQAGGRRMLLVPPGMAYGNREIDGTIPANASLMIQIDLVAVEDPD